MFSVNQKRDIADAVQKILRATNHPELPHPFRGEINFHLHVEGGDPSCSWADIKNNGACKNPSVNHHNEAQDPAPADNKPTCKFENVSCSQCGKEFGPGDHGFSHCEDHEAIVDDCLNGRR